MSAKIQDLPRDRDAEPAAQRFASDKTSGKTSSWRGRVLSWVLTIAAFGIVAAGVDAYWLYANRHPSTDNAYVEANIVQVAASANGVVSEVSVKEFARVKSGDVLVRVDDRPAVKAPTAGIVGKISISQGSTVRAGMNVLSLVDTSKWWIEANFKETDLARIAPGQPATVVLDLNPAHEFKGTVEAISPASVASSSLFPPENATGSWVKVTQRFPVRIAINSESLNDTDLRVGASASVTIDTASDNSSGKK